MPALKPPLSLPRDPFGEIFRILADAIKNDPTIRSTGASVLLQDGAELDFKYPWIRLSARPDRATTYLAEDGKENVLWTMRFDIETCVDGTRFEDSSRLGFAILNSLYPEDEMARQRLESKLATAGLQSRSVEQLPFGVDTFGPPDKKNFPAPPYIYAVGHLNLVVPITL